MKGVAEGKDNEGEKHLRIVAPPLTEKKSVFIAKSDKELKVLVK